MSSSGPFRSPSSLGTETSTSPFSLGPLRLKSTSGMEILGVLKCISGILNLGPFTFPSGRSMSTSGPSMSTLGPLTSRHLEFPLGAVNVHIWHINVNFGAFDVQFRPLQVPFELGDRDIDVPLDLGALEAEVDVGHGDLGGLDVHLGHLELGAFDFPLRPFQLNIGEINIDLGGFDVDVWGFQVTLEFGYRNIDVPLQLGAFEVEVDIGHGDLGGLEVHLGHLELGALHLPLREINVHLWTFNVHLGTTHIQVTLQLWKGHVHIALDLGALEAEVDVRHGDLGGLDVH
ncbi:hypothetical protein DV515_00019984, partial [Chloebia gouldiae]